MRTSQEVRQSERLVITTVSGRFDLGEFGIQRTLLAENVETAGFSLLLNIQHAEVEHLSNADFVGFASAPRMLAPPKCIAVLVTTDAQREMAQAIITVRYHQKHYTKCRIFDQLDKALVWIEVEGK
jgi:hypothetical protein